MDDYEELLNRDVYSQDGEKIGSIDSLYVGNDSSEPLFATVKTGWFSGSSFVPLVDAEVSDDQIVVPYTKDRVKDAPNLEQDTELSPEEENELYEYYGMRRGGADTASDDDYENEEEHEAVPNGYDTSGPNTDDAMTRSEEELDIGTRTQETGRYRLRKYVVTENVTKTVPVEREEVRVEREPITDDNRDQAMSGPELSEEEHEIVTHAEVPTVDKKVVPKERIRLDKNAVTDEETVDEDVRKERIDLDSDEDDRR